MIFENFLLRFNSVYFSYKKNFFFRLSLSLCLDKIQSGRVFVNGKLIQDLGTKVIPKRDHITVNGRRLTLPQKEELLWVMMNKPRNTLSTDAGKNSTRGTVFSLIPQAKQLKLQPVGGLDRDTSGLLLLTNEIGWISPLTQLRNGIRKRFEVTVQHLPTEEQLTRIKKSFRLPEWSKQSLPAQTYPSAVVRLKTADILQYDKRADISLLDVSLEDTVPQQIRRIFESISCPVISMRRIEFAGLVLNKLSRGKWRELKTSEISSLKEMIAAKVNKLAKGSNKKDDELERGKNK